MLIFFYIKLIQTPILGIKHKIFLLQREATTAALQANAYVMLNLKKKVAKIYDTNRKLIRKDGQTRSNLFYLDIADANCLIVKSRYGYRTKGNVMSILITWSVSVT